MIPRIIHYCWFGNNPLPKSAVKCINSWKKYLPGFEIKEWNETNFDVNIIPYTQQAYESRKYAFVSDYARFWILYNYGGIYFDTDVEVIKSFDDILDRGPFMGREAGAYLKNICKFDGEGLAVAPGLGIAAVPHMTLFGELLNKYNTARFLNDDGSLNTKTVVVYTSETLIEYGLSSNNDEIEKIADVWIYPTDYFCPMDHTMGNVIRITANTRSIHRYDASWLNHKTLRHKLHIIKIWLSKFIGPEKINKIMKIFRK